MSATLLLLKHTVTSIEDLQDQFLYFKLNLKLRPELNPRHKLKHKLMPRLNLWSKLEPKPLLKLRQLWKHYQLLEFHKNHKSKLKIKIW